MDKNKVLYLHSAFSNKELPSSGDKIDSVYIEGYASTTDIDRMGDVIPSSVWEKGIQNYLKNPIILFQHDHDDPVGRTVEHRIDGAGLWIKARISAAATEVFDLIRDNVITAFSVGFRILDAEYNAVAEVFLIKEVELIEISVVSVPANQNTLFSLSKAFDDAEEYKKFKEQFAKEESAKGLETSKPAESESHKEWDMDPKELQAMLDAAANNAAEKAAKSILEAQAAEQIKAKKAADEQAELDARIKSAVETTVSTISSGTEKLLEEITKRLEKSEESSKGLVDGLEGIIKEKAEELARIQASKMSFTDNKSAGSTYEERESAFLLSKISGKSIEDTRFGKRIIEKTGAHVPGATWELEVSLNMEAEVRRRLVMAPLLRNIAMQTNVMTIPVNPEAGYATWVTNAQFGTDDSSGAAQTHALTDITLNAYKVATREYMAYEEEEDSLLALLPVVRDAMIRRVARAVDKAYIRGAGSGADPVKGVAKYDASSAVTVSAGSGVVDVDDMIALRRDLGAWGLNPADIVFVVSTDVYYDLLQDTKFQTMNQVGPAATLLTGQIGSVGNSPVIVSAEFDTKADTAIGAFVFAPANFLAGNQRGLRFDTQELVETQRRVLVASLRTGIVQITTNLGQAVSTLRYTA